MSRADCAYEPAYGQHRLEHGYGERVTFLHNPFSLSLMSAIGSQQCVQPALGDLVHLAYQYLAAETFSLHLATETREIATRMESLTEKGVYRGTAFAAQKVVSVAIARAGIVPSEVCFRLGAALLGVDGLRQDHFAMARQTNEAGEVIGVAVSGEKIGGDVDGATVLLPDPMGATGSSLSTAVRYYRDHVEGTPAQVIAMAGTGAPVFAATRAKRGGRSRRSASAKNRAGGRRRRPGRRGGRSRRRP